MILLDIDKVLTGDSLGELSGTPCLGGQAEHVRTVGREHMRLLVTKWTDVFKHQTIGKRLALVFGVILVALSVSYALVALIPI